MNRLDFELPEYIRVSWVSNTAKQTWEPRLNRIIKAWQEIEWLAVVEGIRACATISILPESLITMGEKWVKAGLTFLPIGYQDTQNYSYFNENLGEYSTKRVLLNVIIGASKQNVLDFKYASEAANNLELVGELLGYPVCCQSFFRQVLENGQTDATWHMAAASIDPLSKSDNCISIDSNPFVNVLWRWLGVRAIPHIPCSFGCKNSLDIAKEYINIGRKFGHHEEMDWLLEILTWPVQWSALHGIAEIKTPILKVSTKTDATSVKCTVKCVSEIYPTEGAKGLDFPYRISRHPQVTSSKGYLDGLDNHIETKNPHPNHVSQSLFPETWYYEDNGFSSPKSMDTAHKPIEELAVDILSKSSFNILDLGCGNGALLKKIQAVCPKVMPFGIDNDSTRIEHARRLLPIFRNNFAVGDLVKFKSLLPGHQHYELVMIAISRLEEMDQSQFIAFRGCIQEHCDNMLVYDYWNRDLAKIALQIGVHLICPVSNARASLAKFSIIDEVPSLKMQQSKSGNGVYAKEFHNGSNHADYSDHNDSVHDDYTDHGDC